MGGNVSSVKSPNEHVFKKELELINRIVTNIINDKNLFKNRDYDFLSKDICNKYQFVLEEQLSKYLKIDVKSLGTALYIIPKEDTTERLTKHNLTKQQICEKISNHYIKILYVLTLVKYVYNIEKDGDLSIYGIIMRNIRVLDDIMEINFCDLPHRNYSNKIVDETYKIDFAKLEGFKFFIDYFLDNAEAGAFLGLVKSILARTNKQKVESTICSYITNNQFNQNDIKYLEQLYMDRFGSKFVCVKNGGTPQDNDKNGFKLSKVKYNLNLNIFINKDNPILTKEFCFAPRKIIIKTSTVEGRKVLDLYNKMKNNYNKNIEKINSLLDKLVIANGDKVELRDIDKNVLDVVLGDVKLNVKAFYLQSIIDYQNLLDKARLTPNIEGN